MSWETGVFLAPIVAAALLFAGVAFGGGEDGDGVGKEFGKDVGGDGHHAHDASHAMAAHGEQSSGGPLSFLGVGRVPLGVVVVSLLSTFGSAGFVISTYAGGNAAAGALGGGVAAIFLTRWMSKLVSRVLPSRESYNVRKSDLIGRSGRAIGEVTVDDGFVQVTDHEGNLHQVRARTSGATLPKGATLLLVERVPERDVYVVEAFDPETPDTGASSSESPNPVAGGREPTR